uniref:Uncharacterized protein n=1 Tax=Oryza punctata TaxID=4537 RepID=A0A0E0JZ10_ORYPU
MSPHRIEEPGSLSILTLPPPQHANSRQHIKAAAKAKHTCTSPFFSSSLSFSYLCLATASSPCSALHLAREDEPRAKDELTPSATLGVPLHGCREFKNLQRPSKRRNLAVHCFFCPHGKLISFEYSMFSSVSVMEVLNLCCNDRQISPVCQC